MNIALSDKLPDQPNCPGCGYEYRGDDRGFDAVLLVRANDVDDMTMLLDGLSLKLGTDNTDDNMDFTAQIQSLCGPNWQY